ncbi:hypothetical protein D3C78_1710920 [compost metagenome]
MPGGDIDDAHLLPLRLQPAHRHPQEFLDMQLALANAAPADGVQVIAIDKPSNRANAAGLVAIDVVQRTA